MYSRSCASGANEPHPGVSEVGDQSPLSCHQSRASVAQGGLCRQAAASLEAGDPDGKSSRVGTVVQSWSVNAQSGSGRVVRLGWSAGSVSL